MRTAIYCGLAMTCLLAIGCNGNSSIDTTKLPPPVNSAVTNTSASGPQAAAADALGHIGQPAVAPLADALTDPDPSVRLQACRALAYMGAKAANAVPALERALSDSDSTVREQAAIALGQIGAAAEPAVPALMLIMKAKPSYQP
jgi:HEAT repeats